jgi:gamma-glutamyltranspeptidase/glutathione hydrolase
MDAVLAANFALGVVAPYFCGYGGDIFAVVWDGELHGYLGSGRSPAGATIDAVRDASGQSTMPPIGPHSVTVPGAVAGWFELLERWGTRSFGDLAGDALRYARDGFTVSEHAAPTFAMARDIYTDDPAFQEAYAGIEAGSVLRQPALARTIEALAADGPAAYYGGPIGAAIAETMHVRGGLMTAADVAGHRGEWAQPLRVPYRGTEIVELPPPTQGVVALEALGILDGIELPEDGPERQHLLVEAVKLAFETRDEHVTDPQHMTLSPAELLDPARLTERRARIDPMHARSLHGTAHVGGTAYLCATDADGLMVSLIQSNFFGFGAGVHVGEWGINLNNRGASFSFDDAHVNRLAPGKLPMHTLVPAMVLRDGSPSIVFGSMGGDAQIQVHVQLLARMIDDGVDPQRAIGAPRWRIEPWTGRLHVERDVPEDVQRVLAERGNEIVSEPRLNSGMGHAHAIRVEPGGYAVATDPRAEGAAVGV